MSESENLKKIFHSQYPSLCWIANRYIANQTICEDIVQECFVKYWEFCEKGKIIENPSAYLTTAVKNSCINYLRKEVHIENIDEIKYSAPNFFVEDDDDEKDSTDEMQIIKLALGKLPTKCREIFELSKIQKKSYKEIAENLEISIKTVENQMGKALKIMREFVKENPQYFPLALLFFQSIF